MEMITKEYLTWKELKIKKVAIAIFLEAMTIFSSNPIETNPKGHAISTYDILCVK